MEVTTTGSPFGSATRTRVLVALGLLRSTYQRELARLLETSPSVVQKALVSLERDGLVAGRLVGRTRTYKLNPRVLRAQGSGGVPLAPCRRGTGPARANGCAPPPAAQIWQAAVIITRDSTLPEVALAVGAQLTRRRIRATLTGGACVAIYTGTYSSKDADFVVEGRVRQRDLDDALAEVGFERRGARYVHPETDFYVEFPPGPLSIGEDLAIRPVQLAVVGDAAAFGLSPTDCCRDRLAAVLSLGRPPSTQAGR